MEPKNWAESKTLFVGILTVIAAALTDPSVAAIVPLEWAPRVLALVGVVNIVLRFVTNKPLRR